MTQRVTGRDGRGLENGCWQKDQMKVRWVRWTVDGRRMSREVGIVFDRKWTNEERNRRCFGEGRGLVLVTE